MRTMRVGSQTYFTIALSLLLGGLGGCAETGVDRPEEFPEWVVPASPEVTQATQGVLAWEVYRKDAALTVLGVDQAGVPMTDTRVVRLNVDTDNEVLKVESVVPSDGVAEFRPDGTLASSTITRQDAKVVTGMLMQELTRITDPAAGGKFDSNTKKDFANRSCNDESCCVKRCHAREQLCRDRCGDGESKCDPDCKSKCSGSVDYKNTNGSSCDGSGSDSSDSSNSSSSSKDSGDSSSSGGGPHYDGCENIFFGFGNWLGACVGNEISCWIMGCKKNVQCKAYNKHWIKCTGNKKKK